MSKGMIYKMDFLTKEPSLFIFGKKKYYTKIGVIISFIVFICSLGFGMYFLYDFFELNESKVAYLEETYGFNTKFESSILRINKEDFLCICGVFFVIFNIQSKAFVLLNNFHSNDITSMVRIGENLCATGSRDKTIKIWKY